MRSFAGYLVVALVLAGAGSVCWLVGDAERQVAAEHEQLMTLRFDAAAATEAEDALGPVGRLPGVGNALTADARDARATAQYWLSRYDELKPASGGAQRDPHLLVMAANAAYRATSIGGVDRTTAFRRLNDLINTYRDVLKTNAGDEEAAYNFEFAIRTRDAIARQRTGTSVAKANDSEAAPTIHGHPGAPPKNIDLAEFKIVVPKNSDERGDNQEAGKGVVKRRRG